MQVCFCHRVPIILLSFWLNSLFPHFNLYCQPLRHTIRTNENWVTLSVMRARIPSSLKLCIHSPTIMDKKIRRQWITTRWRWHTLNPRIFSVPNLLNSPIQKIMYPPVETWNKVSLKGLLRAIDTAVAICTLEASVFWEGPLFKAWNVSTKA